MGRRSHLCGLLRSASHIATLLHRGAEMEGSYRAVSTEQSWGIHHRGSILTLHIHPARLLGGSSNGINLRWLSAETGSSRYGSAGTPVAKPSRSPPGPGRVLDTSRNQERTARRPPHAQVLPGTQISVSGDHVPGPPWKIPYSHPTDRHATALEAGSAIGRYDGRYRRHSARRLTDRHRSHRTPALETALLAPTDLRVERGTQSTYLLDAAVHC